MIDDKKIEEAARRNADKYRNYPTLSDEDRDKVSICSFMEGTKWMQEEFFKNLWHPASEVPEIGRVIIMENYYPDNRIMFISRMRKSTFHNPIDIGNTKKWFYIDDLFPKEGGKQ